MCRPYFLQKVVKPPSLCITSKPRINTGKTNPPNRARYIAQLCTIKSVLKTHNSKLNRTPCQRIRQSNLYAQNLKAPSSFKPSLLTPHT